jgi:hypothetical protein
MDGRSLRRQHGQAIVLIALMIAVMFGLVGLAIDSGRAYLDRRHLQAAVDATALGAAYTYMNTQDYSQSEQVGVSTYASNEGIYGAASCTGLGSTFVSCVYSGDPTNQVMTITVTNKSIAGVSFAVTGTGTMAVAMMQVLGAGPNISVSAVATAVARRSGTNGAAIQTLSPGTCNGTSASLTFTGTSTTNVTGDVWSNGSITDNGVASGTINGNAIAICPTMPPSPLPNFTVTGTQANGWTMPDPAFPEPTLNTSSESWDSASGSVEQPGTYASDPKLAGGAGCYFLAGGVYTWSAGFTQNGGFVSNELRPPDEPQLAAANQPIVTTTTSAIAAGSVSAIPVSGLGAAIPGSTTVSVGGQSFTVASGGAAAGATSISLARNQSAGTAIPSGSWLAVRALPQFWDSNGVGCSTTFSLTPKTADINNPPVSAQTWAVELTAVRWAPYGVPSCNGPGSTTCFLRESPPSMCKTVTVGGNQNFKVAVSSSPADPGAQSFNVYLSPSGSCQGPFGYAVNFSNSGSYGMTVNGSTLTGWSIDSGAPLDNPGAPAPDFQSLPVAAGLPNANPPGRTPPRGDMANEGHCVDSTTGGGVACPGGEVTPGAVAWFIPGGGNNQTCLNLQGGGDIYVFSGYQYLRILLYEPGPEQQPPANTCSNNVAGSGITSLIGIFYVPAANVTIVGNSSYLATIAGGVIAWTASVKGNGGVSISADPTLRTWPPSVNLTQ